MNTINKENSGYQDRPVKVVQFGEGNFLRAFADEMIDAANEQNIFDGNIVMLKPTPVRAGSGTFESFRHQECQYTLVLRGRKEGRTVCEKRKITSVKEILSIYDDWHTVLKLAALESLQIIISNTTEAGIIYKEEERTADVPPATYPGKLTAFLYERFVSLHGAADQGLIILPVELIEDNGDVLESCVLHYAESWKLGEEFAQWIRNACTFCNTLVDRIVPGFPREEAQTMWEELGYRDDLLDVAEPFGLWVIEDKGDVREKFPLDRAGMPVLFAESVRPYKQRKVRILNGAHTSFALASFLSGNDDVLSSMNDECIRTHIMKVLYEEVLPTLTLPEDEVKNFAAAVIERFENPFIKHQLLSISLNSVSKWRERCMPSLLAYEEKNGRIPEHLAFSLAALLQFYTGTELQNGVLTGHRKCGETSENYQIHDDQAVLEFFAQCSRNCAADFVKNTLEESSFWGQDLTQIPGLARLVTEDLENIRRSGMRAALEQLEGNR